jgi:hypothetical protein
MLKKLLTAAVVSAVVKVLIDRLMGGTDEADLWAEATDSVDVNR